MKSAGVLYMGIKCSENLSGTISFPALPSILSQNYKYYLFSNVCDEVLTDMRRCVTSK